MLFDVRQRHSNGFVKRTRPLWRTTKKKKSSEKESIQEQGQARCLVIIIHDNIITLIINNEFLQGPNFIWHVDGYDKLTPYGITLHGCIDGWVTSSFTKLFTQY